MKGRRLVSGLAVLLVACASRDSRPATVVDTLPGGIIAVHNSAPVAWQDSTTWRFVEVTRVASGDSGAGILVNPGFAAAMDGSGQMYVVDQAPTRIKVFDSTGRFIRSIGRDGEGPGEYRQPMIAARGPHLYVQDTRLRRVSAFDTSGTYIRSFPSDGSYFGPDGISLDDSARIWIRIFSGRYPDRAVTMLRYDTMGTLLDTLWLMDSRAPAVWVVERPGGRATYNIPGAPRELAAVTPSGLLLRGWSGNYSLALQRRADDTMRVILRDWTPVKLPEAERVERFGQFRAMVSRGLSPDLVKATFHLYDMPTERPPMQAIDVDPAGRIWVKIVSADTTASFFDAFDSTGVWRGTLRSPWPASAVVVWRGADRVLVRETDADGVASFVAYRLVTH